MRPALRGKVCAFAFSLACLFTASLAWAQEYSHARIVRLSFTEGTVTVQRPDVTDWAEAFVNTPLQDGFKVATTEDGFAEVEFENASTARLGQQTLLEFSQLVLKPSGGKINRLRLHQGYATFNFIPENDDLYEVSAGDATLTPRGKSRFRLDMEPGLLLVKVFKGAVEVVSPEGNGTVGENAMLELRYGAEQVFHIAQGFTRDAWDEWVEQREGQTEFVRHRGGAPTVYSNDVTDLLYGWADLGLYGNWVQLPGYGYGWMPGGVGMGWQPFMHGHWGWYPGFGYTWISFEPWGWLPYHYGYWTYYPGLGWCWIPTGFSMWSPAVVNWYQGPGWVGWSPRTGPGGQDPCPRGQGCGTTVSEDTFRRGGRIIPERILGEINPRVGRRVERPDIGPADTPVGAPTGRVGPRAGAPSGGGIVFDPEERRYVNDPILAPEVINVEDLPGAGERGPRSAPTRVGSAVGSGEAGAGVGRASRPGPQGGVAVPSAERSPWGEDRFGEPSGTSRIAPRGSDGRAPGAAPRGDRQSGPQEGWGRSSRSSDTRSSGERSTPSPRSSGEGGSVSPSSSSGGHHGTSGGHSTGGHWGGGGGGSSGGGGGGGGGSAPPSAPPSGGRPPR